MSGGWWRCWHGAPGDTKWRIAAAEAGCLPAEVAALVWALLDFASQASERGTVRGFNLRIYAFDSGTSAETAQRILDALHQKDLGVLADGRFINWEKRQPRREDDSSGRVRRHREAVKRNVTRCNAPEEEEDTEERVSEAGASGGETPPPPPAPTPIDLEAAIWASGPPLLVGLGLSEHQARKMIGRWRKDFGNAAVLDALSAAQAESPSDVVAWMSATLRRRDGQRPASSEPQNPMVRAVLARERERTADADDR